MSDEAARSKWLYEAGKAALAARFDPERELIRAETEDGLFYLTRESLKYARYLLRDAAPGDADSALAARIIAQIVALQERQPGNIHEGGFPWMADDGHVSDLNAVQFLAEEFCHILIESADKLPAPTLTATKGALRLALAEIARLDVAPAYTNICLLDCHNSILGGQLLDAPGWVERGARKLARWAAEVAASGAPREYNSPTYAGVDLGALAAIAEEAADPAIRLLACLMEERLWLHAALHYHAPTAQLAGPHSRAYQNDVTGGRGSLKTALYKILGDERLIHKTPFYPLRQGDGNAGVGVANYHCPAPIRAILQAPRLPLTVREGADLPGGLDLSTTLTADWALGVASRGYGPQANNLLLHYRKDTEPGFGVVYSRFILNDRRLGGSYHATDRTRSNNVSDVGDFRGLHTRNKAIGVYGLLPQAENLTAAKLDIFWPGLAASVRALIGTEQVGSLPTELPPGVPLIIKDGAVYIGVLPTRHSNLGRTAPIRLERDGDDLVLSIVIYEGPPKRFWEYSALAGPFYRGNIECGFILEVASRDEFATVEEFAAHLAAASLADATAEGVRHLRYRSGGDDLTLRYQLTDMAVTGRSINGVPLEVVPLDAPCAVQRGDAPLRLGAITLDAPVDAAANWLYTTPDGAAIVAGRTTTQPGPLTLALPGGQQIEAEALGLARVEVALERKLIAIEVAAAPGAVTLRGWPVRPTLTINGRTLPEEAIHPTGPGEWMTYPHP
jgi:hypothetical protein